MLFRQKNLTPTPLRKRRGAKKTEPNSTSPIGRAVKTDFYENPHALLFSPPYRGGLGGVHKKSRGKCLGFLLLHLPKP